MKICHVITRMIIGGAQENTLLSCRGAIEEGHEVTLITGKSPGPEGNLLNKISIHGLRIIEIPQLVRSINPLCDLLAYLELKSIFKEEKFDVVHTHSSKAGFIGRLAAWKNNTKIVIHTIHGQAFHQYQSKIINNFYILAERIAAKHCDKILAVANAMITQSIEAKIAEPSKFAVNYSGMEIDNFINAQRSDELKKELNIPENAVVIGTLARLFELKGYELLLNAAPKIIAEIPNIHFLFIGDGVNRQKYETQISKLGITKYFSFAGLISPNDVPQYLAQIDILAHFSLREGLPRAVVQALAEKKGVVAFPLDGTPEVVIDQKTGIICPVNDIEKIVEAITLLAKNEKMRNQFGTAGQNLVANNFHWRKMSSDILNTYHEIAREKQIIIE